MSRHQKLTRSFYGRPTLEVAPDLLGKFLVHASSREVYSARIVEVEAYIGEEDPACHAACGPTERNRIMYGPPGFAYIYFIYGMYYCLNFVTEPKGRPAAVLIRAAEPFDGFDRLLSKQGGAKGIRALSGPGKLCRAFGLTFQHNGLDLTGRRLYLEDRGSAVSHIRCSTRIGIRKGADKLWRFFDADSAVVSSRRLDSRPIRATNIGVSPKDDLDVEIAH
ncbi:MAG: DNA-3-methyladenine glycosylase [Candidatus Zixiibacteriota bacterium]